MVGGQIGGAYCLKGRSIVVCVPDFHSSVPCALVAVVAVVAIMCDTAGWYQDPFHTAPDSPCAVPEGWFHAVMGVSAIAWGLHTVGVVASIAILHRGGESWLSHRMLAVGFNGMVYGVSYVASYTALWAAPEEFRLEEKRAAGACEGEGAQPGLGRQTLAHK